MSSINYGDTVFIAFPALSSPIILTNVVTGTNPNITILRGTNGTIADADPYVIDPTPGHNVGSALNNNDIIRLRRLGDSQQRVITDGYSTNLNGRTLGIAYLTNNTGNDTYWKVVSVLPSTGPITYGQQIRLENVNTGRDILYIVLTIPGILTSSDNTSGSIISFVPGPLDNAQLQCCRDDPSLIQLGLCGDYKGTSCTGNCDTILTNYCAQVTTSDPKCGCILPPSFYATSRLVGPPECIDDRCVNTNSYRKSTQCKPNCNIINCVINANDIAGSNIDKIIFEQKCGNLPTPGTPGIPGIPGTTGSNRLRIFLVILIIIIVLIILGLFLYFILKK
ncbi:hypothetical protein H012_gp309 [Acanthamoeba polyphaga moumouvirus]|uniref:Virion-associated membrane protein n=1 Tax=Acanthamoeba polyphaga moumouvirus TaxID=1269028 RepID=L7RGF8_9VIRU|nr:hypothetical protein H012_gp309 [Acanthamoeba polyphaga moumouvirus]AGC02145.1 hypothetical protein Moumou_00621 [Acanthamoeba polyphaga moumouvirus]